jgi:hypothetical protein
MEINKGEIKKEKLIKITGLWNSTKQSTGEEYLRGKAQDGNVYMVFKNTRKTIDSQPDFELYVSEAESIKQEG